MDVIKNEISKEEYEEYKNMTVGERDDIVRKSLPDSIIWGYGYYGNYLVEDDGNYYLCLRVGSSCD